MSNNKRSSLLRSSLTRIIAAAGVIVMLGLLVAPNAFAWWDSKWQQRKKIQFDTSAKAADIKENLNDLPVLIRLNTGNFSFSSAKADGSDIRFVSSDDKSPLKYHIEMFDSKEELALIWVKVPRITAGSDQNSIWLYYGNASAPDGQDAGGTYDVNQVAVYHLSELDGNPKDATAYGNNSASFSGKLGIPSAVGNGARFGAAGDKITIARSPSLNFSKGLTFSAWVRPSETAGTANLFSWNDGSLSIVVGMDDGKAYGSVASGKGTASTTPKTASLAAGLWHHLAVTVEPDKQITLYVNGVEAASAQFKGPVPSPSSDIIIAGSEKGVNPFRGELDEVELSNLARPAAWIRAAFQSQGPEGVLTSYMEEESGGGGGGESLTIHLAKVIIRTITLDGWLIIGVLVLLGFASLYIFRQKIVLLNQAKKENQNFLQSFQKLDHPLSLLQNEDDFQGSTLYRVYHAGCEELKICIEKRGESLTCEAGLSGRAMNGFRASIEKAAMYESRRLSAGMVIMNMSVAGGPFLGLLGTVWGVMNTFAGLAESGEANLAAIAPGVASALSCTLAGLLVAIPALFASSYITGRIKDMNADVNVFMDDFILKLEEEK